MAGGPPAQQGVSPDGTSGQVASRPDSIRALRQAILGEATEEAQQILHDAEAKAESIRLQAESRAKIDRETILAFIEELAIPVDDKERLRSLTPAAYAGYAESLAKDV